MRRIISCGLLFFGGSMKGSYLAIAILFVIILALFIYRWYTQYQDKKQAKQRVSDNKAEEILKKRYLQIAHARKVYDGLEVKLSVYKNDGIRVMLIENDEKRSLILIMCDNCVHAGLRDEMFWLRYDFVGYEAPYKGHLYSDYDKRLLDVRIHVNDDDPLEGMECLILDRVDSDVARRRATPLERVS